MVIEYISVYYYNDIIIYLLYTSLVAMEHLLLLCIKLRELNADWEQFGTALHVPYATIQEMKENPNRLSAEKKMRAVLDKWRQQSSKQTWREIYNAVVNLQDIALANHIKQLHPNLDSKG